MNFLAHLLLSGNDEEVMVGNFIGDFVKGPNLEAYPPNISYGIKLHRAIDTFTDSHPVVLKSKVRLRKKFRHYAPVIVDVFYDHFIARDWHLLSNQSLLEFTHHFYERIKSYYDLIPPAVIHMLGYMREANWLYHYQYIEGIDKALTGMSRRTKFDSKMEQAARVLEAYYSEFENEFKQFFPEIQSHVANFKP
ncbi:MAG: acyl carrier protein phosphodiesterase [Ekhidna sp.]